MDKVKSNTLFVPAKEEFLNNNSALGVPFFQILVMQTLYLTLS
jgi:hypothetical protein